MENPPTGEGGTVSNTKLPLFIPEDGEQDGDENAARAQDCTIIESDGEPMSTDDTGVIPPTKELCATASSPVDEPLLAQKRPRSVSSPGSVSDEEVNRSKRARPPSPAPAPAPSSSSSSQRLAGPGRSSARVEQILSENTSGTGRAVQMVLDTSGASWNLKPGQEGPLRKRPNPLDVSGSSSGKSARVNMRARLARFTRDGARVVQNMGYEGDSDSPEEEEVTEQILADEERSSSSKTMDNNADDLEVGNEGLSSMDVVDETMVIDLSQSEDEPLKLPDDDSSCAAAAAASSTSPPADDDLTSNDELLPDSRSDGAQSVSATTTTAPSSPSKHSGVRAEIVRTTVGDAPPLAFDLERTTNAWSAYLERKSTSQPAQPATRSSDLESADLGADDENATAALARVLSKADFSSMDVVGQFNRGFIVARLCKTGGEGATDDLFIVDQHAADEKYNFETLQATTRLESQKLFT
jgi:DNA mismatch repair protein PMS2